MSTSNTWFTSDTHFQHWSNAERNIIKYSNRPFSTISEHDAVLEANWNDNVKPEDTVYHLGDICLGNRRLFVSTILPRLNGNIKLVPGNHDRLEFFKDTKIEILPLLCRIKIDGRYIILCHYSLRSWEFMQHESYAFYGHSHGGLDDLGGKTIDVGVDSVAAKLAVGIFTDTPLIPPFVGATLDQKDYRPVSFKEVHKFMCSRPIEKVDHH